MQTIDYDRFENFHANFQRNGVCGISFMSFFWYDAIECKNFCATSHEWREDDARGKRHDEGFYAVICLDDPRSCWRGDHFIDGLMLALDAYRAKYGEMAPHEHV